jgi:hypothetical protein
MLCELFRICWYADLKDILLRVKDVVAVWLNTEGINDSIEFLIKVVP